MGPRNKCDTAPHSCKSTGPLTKSLLAHEMRRAVGNVSDEGVFFETVLEQCERQSESNLSHQRLCTGIETSSRLHCRAGRSLVILLLVEADRKDCDHDHDEAHEGKI
jgi:hypothetical protein